MYTHEQVFKWGSFFPNVEVPKEEHRKRSRSSHHHGGDNGNSTNSSSSSSSSSSTATTRASTSSGYLSIDAATGLLVDRSVDIMTIPSANSAADNEQLSQSSNVDATLMWWGIRPEPLLTQEVSTDRDFHMFACCQCWTNNSNDDAMFL